MLWGRGVEQKGGRSGGEGEGGGCHQSEVKILSHGRGGGMRHNFILTSRDHWQACVLRKGHTRLFGGRGYAIPARAVPVAAYLLIRPSVCLAGAFRL